MFQGIMNGMGDLPRLFDAQSRSITPENLTGEQGKGGDIELCDGTQGAQARDLGKGWKVQPLVKIPAGETFTLADIEGPGMIGHIWMTPTGKWRDAILRIYWDEQTQPSVECPVGDFFCSGWERFSQVTSLAVCVNPGRAFNCYWNMPFRKRCRMTVENRSREEMCYYYQIDYTLMEIPEDCGYFHAQFRRVNPVPKGEVYTIVDGICGQGIYVGTYMAFGVHDNGWWGEGEVKFYIDDDKDYPTICGTGTEDYFCGSYNFEDPNTKGHYLPYCTPYAGLSQVIEPDCLYHSQMRFGMYRWHITDPIRFRKSLKVTVHDLGWCHGNIQNRKYLPRQDDIASVAFWYQSLPTAPFPELPDRDALEVI